MTANANKNEMRAFPVLKKRQYEDYLRIGKYFSGVEKLDSSQIQIVEVIKLGNMSRL